MRLETKVKELTREARDLAAKAKEIEGNGTCWNGINLSPRSLSPQAFSEDVSWLRHAVVFFRPSFDDTGFEAVRAMGNDFQFA